MKTAIVIGVGPNRGLGAQLCKRFAADGLRVIVAGRTQSAIEAVADDITPSANEGSRSCVAVCPPQASGVGKLDSFGNSNGRVGGTSRHAHSNRRIAESVGL